MNAAGRFQRGAGSARRTPTKGEIGWSNSTGAPNTIQKSVEAGNVHDGVEQFGIDGLNMADA